MARGTQILLGGILLAVGTGAVAFGYQAWKSGSSRPSGNVVLSTSPPEPLSVGTEEITAILAVTNDGSASQVFAVQGAFIDGGVVTGHWWVSMDQALSAIQMYNAGDTVAAAQLAAQPQNRIATVTVPAGQRVSVSLYDQPTLSIGQEWLFWVLSGTSGLLANDALGTPVSTLPAATLHVTLIQNTGGGGLAYG